MNGRFFFILILTFSFQAKANFKSFVREFLEKNYALQEYRLQKNLLEYDWQEVQASKYWSVDASIKYSDSSLESSSQTTSLSESETTTTNLGLNYSSSFGGDFSFTNTMVHDIDKASSSSILSSTDVYGFSQQISYTQDLTRDLFGKTYKLNLSEADLKAKAAKIEFDQKMESQLYDLYTGYLDVQLAKTLLKNQENALQRSLAREKSIQKRVKDGVRERVDLYQAQISRISQKENVRNSRQTLLSALQSISLLVDRKVSLSEIEALDLNNYEAVKVSTGEINENKNLMSLNKKLEASKLSLKKIDQLFLPEVDFQISYETNDFDSKRGKSISNGTLGNDNREWIFYVDFSMPIGYGVEKVKKAKVKTDLLLKENEVKKLNSELEKRIHFLNEKILLVKENIKSSKVIRTISKRALKEQNRLYNLGRSDIDNVIRSEEELIRAENGLASKIAAYEKVIASKSLIYGNLAHYLGLEGMFQ